MNYLFKSRGPRDLQLLSDTSFLWHYYAFLKFTIACFCCISTCIAIARGQYTQRLRITDLPPEILQKVFDLLPQITQGCFALSCQSFYQKFQYIFREPMFRFPCSDGIDHTVNIESRHQFLTRLQTREISWLRLFSPRWTYCNTCLKLHPRNEFHDYQFQKNQNFECMWPGIIALCPCLIFSPRKLIRLGHDLSRASFDMDELRRVIPNWHQCSFVSICGKLSYSLDISLSLTQRGFITFHFTYLISVDEVSPYQGGRKIMLCPHTSALKFVGQSISQQARMCSCIRSQEISFSQNIGYTISFTRSFSIPRKDGFSHPGRVDYHWS